MPQTCDLLIHNVRIASMTSNGSPYGQIHNAVVAIQGEQICFVGELNDCPFQPADKFDAQQQWLLPGLIDCHTHLVYGGNRAKEFELRLQGVSYEEIARQGGGIKSTVKATRESDHATLLSSALKRASRLSEEGVTTVEIKSGYGLDMDTEIRMLEVAKDIPDHLPLMVETTFLGAHALPQEFQSDPDGYIDFVCHKVMPVVAQKKLATCVDVFCESIGFSPAQSEQVFLAAQQNGLSIKAHVEQLSDLKGAVLASQYQALSVDHIEYLAEQDVPRLKEAGTVAVLLPGAFYCLHETQLPPMEALREHQVPMAIATDLNPGSSPVASLLSVMNMACTLFKMTPEEALYGTTKHAAKALGLSDRGLIQSGLRADLCLWDIESPGELAYGMNLHRPTHKWLGGKHV